jgi:uncharacterized membrane protein YjfL (UPF0719 family)
MDKHTAYYVVLIVMFKWEYLHSAVKYFLIYLSSSLLLKNVNIEYKNHNFASGFVLV